MMLDKGLSASERKIGKRLYDCWRVIMVLLIVMSILATITSLVTRRWTLLEIWLFVFIHLIMLVICSIDYYSDGARLQKGNDPFENPNAKFEFDKIFREYKIAFIFEYICVLLCVPILVCIIFS